MSTVGIIVNPHAGKDIRRLSAEASHTSDWAKIGMVRRVVLAAADMGVDKILLAPDRNQLSQRAVERLDVPHAVLDGDPVGARTDTVRGAQALRAEGVDAVVVLGGDGTCRDVATGWPQAPLVAISTGTNNVFPAAVDATSAGTAAALVAIGAVTIGEAADQAKQICVAIDEPEAYDGRRDDGRSDDGRRDDGVLYDDLALVDLALIDAAFLGARAVTDASSIRLVLAAFADPAGTGLSSIAGRAHPVTRSAQHGVFVRIGEGGRRIQVPLSPGRSDTVELAAIEEIPIGSSVEFDGPGVLAFDGERDRPVSSRAHIVATIERNGPRVIDVERTMAIGAERKAFDDHNDRARGV